MKCATVPAASQAKVQAKLLDKGVDVCIPTRENGPYDLLAKDAHGMWHHIQVKTAYETKEGVRVNISRTTSKGRKPYRADEVDQFAVVHKDDVYLIPESEVHGVGRINILSPCYRKWLLT